MCLGIEYEYVPVNPLKRDEFLKINPMGAVPALVDGDVVVSDSLAIIMVSIIITRSHIILCDFVDSFHQNLCILTVSR